VAVKELEDEKEILFQGLNLEHTDHDKNIGVQLSREEKENVKELAEEVGLDSKGIQQWLHHFQNKAVPRSVITSLASEANKNKSDIDIFLLALMKSPNFRYVLKIQGQESKEKSYQVKYGPLASHVVNLRKLRWVGFECLAVQNMTNNYKSPREEIFLTIPDESVIGAEICFCTTQDMELGKFEESVDFSCFLPELI